MDQSNQSSFELSACRIIVVYYRYVYICTVCMYACVYLALPLPVLIVVGEKAFQMIDSQIFVAMNNEMPEPRP